MQALCVSDFSPFIPKVPNHTTENTVWKRHKKNVTKFMKFCLSVCLYFCLSVCPFLKKQLSRMVIFLVYYPFYEPLDISKGKVDLL